jgi:hypothetical protein
MFFKPKPLKELENMLNKAGFQSENPDITVAWKVFKQFTEIKFKSDDDALLFECGTYDFTGQRLFYWNLIRQFSFDKNGEYDHMEQLHMEFIFSPTEELDILNDTIWSYDHQSFKEFFDKVETLDSFTIPWQNQKPINIKIFQERV